MRPTATARVRMTRLLDVLLGLLAIFGLLTLADGALVSGVVSIALAAGGAMLVPRGGRAAGPTFSREAAHVADALVDQVLFDHFDLSDAELEALAAVLPEPVRGPAPFWFLLHAGWLVREASRHRYGDPFVAEVRAAMQARLRLKGGNFDGPRWFATLDGAFARSDAAMRRHEDDDPSPSLRIARSLLETNDSSPYQGRLGVPADVDTQLAACLRALEEHLAPMVEAFAGLPAPTSAAPVADGPGITGDAGPRERHLARRQDNLYFPPDRRVVSPEELAQARADDQQECALLRSRAGEAVAASAGEVLEFDATHCQARLGDLAALIEACGRYASAETHALREQCRAAALALVAAARRVPSAAPEMDAAWQGWLDGEEARFHGLAVGTRPDEFDGVPPDDVPALVCSWPPERIRDLAARLGVDSPPWQQLVPQAVERLLAAEQEGVPGEEVSSRLAALGRPRDAAAPPAGA